MEQLAITLENAIQKLNGLLSVENTLELISEKQREFKSVKVEISCTTELLMIFELNHNFKISVTAYKMWFDGEQMEIDADSLLIYEYLPCGDVGEEIELSDKMKWFLASEMCDYAPGSLIESLEDNYHEGRDEYADYQCDLMHARQENR